MLTWYDYAVLLIIGLSTLIGLWRGLVAEVFSLIGWVAAFVVAWHYAHLLAPYLPAHLPGEETTQWILAFAILVFGVMLAAALLSALLKQLINAIGLRSLDSSFGILFGFARGVLLVLVLAMLAKLTDLPKQAFWRKALLRPYVEQGVDVVRPLFPRSHPDRISEYSSVKEKAQRQINKARALLEDL